MYLQAELNKIYTALKESEALENYIVIKAYPYATKPTKLQKSVITVSPAASELKNVTLGEKSAFGTYGIYTDIFIPQESGSPCGSDAVQKIIEILSDFEPVNIKISEFKNEDVLNAFSLRCLFRFSGAISLDGEEING